MQFTILCGGHFATGADNLSDPHHLPFPSPCQCGATNENANKENSLARFVCISVRVTRQRGALNPCPATPCQLNGSVSTLGSKRAMYDLF